jgi:hypothetical protein
MYQLLEMPAQTGWSTATGRCIFGGNKTGFSESFAVAATRATTYVPTAAAGAATFITAAATATAVSATTTCSAAATKSAAAGTTAGSTAFIGFLYNKWFLSH